MTSIFQVDAFTSEPFRGNPAAVCPLDSMADDRWMQLVAAEMNLSETAFLWPEEDMFRLRWFTPSVEVDLCGHATLASSHILWEQGLVDRSSAISFITRSGHLGATRDGKLVVLDFPAEPAEERLDTERISTTLGVNFRGVWRNRFDVLVEIDSESAVREFEPDFDAIAAIECRGLILTAHADDPAHDFVSRFFAPRVGVAEDPVTGSAHCFLGPYWSERLGKQRLTGYQASARGGVVHVNLRGDRVELGGHAVTILEGRLRSQPGSCIG